MPICSKLPTVLGSIKSATEINDNASEAAKVKRTREQAYFNSYNFDAIEVLPYNDVDNVDATKRVAAEQSSKLGRSCNTAPHGTHNTLTKYQNASLSSKSDCSSSGSNCNSNSNNSSRRSSAQSDGSAEDGFMRRSRARASDMNYAYMQRFGAALCVHSRQSSPKQMPATASSGSDEMTLQVGINAKRAETDNGSFLLPRAMLKYQSVGNVNSMPLAIISAATTTTTTTATATAAVHTTGRPDKLLQNGHNHSHSQSRNYSHSYDNNSNNNNNKTMMMITNASNSNSNSNSNTAINATTNNNKHNSSNSNSNSNTHNNATTNPSSSNSNSNVNNNTTTSNNNNKSRLNYANNNDGYASLLIGADTDASLRVVAATAAATATPAIAATTAVAAATPTPTVTSAPSRIKKQSTSSSITTTASSGSVEHELLPSQAVSARGDRSSRVTTEPKSGQKSAASERRGRTSSHQSHYSTDKSGSSGYYSSNVCSTYSLEDHIYCEPVIDILDVSGVKSKSATIPQLLVSTTSEAAVEGAALVANSRSRDMNSVAQGKRFGRRAATGTKDSDDGDEACEDEDCEGDEAFKVESARVRKSKRPSIPGMATRVDATGLQVLVRHSTRDIPTTQHFTDNLRILETSIENLDRHLKNFPSLSSQERIASFVQSHHTYLQLPLGGDMGDRLARAHPHHHLPTIMEGYDPANQPRPWSDDIADDSLLDIDLDSFLLVNERKSGKTIKTLPTATHSGIDNPTFLTDELEENNYKCVKYINSCPDDAYRVESDIVAGTGTASEKSVSLTDHYMKRYEDQLHFQSTRELLEDVRDKIRLLSRANSGDLHSHRGDSPISRTPTEQLPKELENMIKTLKHELETYLDRMNQHSELEIRQLCSGLVKNHNIMKMKKAFERRRSTHSITESDYGYAGAYEAICDGVPASIREQIASIRCASDPNFKMKRKSLTEVFPTADCYVETETRSSVLQDTQHRSSLTRGDRDRDDNVITLHVPTTQMQRNLSFQQPILSKLGTTSSPTDAEPTNGNKNNNNGNGNGNGNGATSGNGSGTGSGAESGESGDKDSILEWHRKKPSIWEMYYGTNRMNQSLLGKRNGVTTNSSTQATMSYPSSRPESDFTLDLPRAEQLRIKMEKEKKFRQRCRYITTFLSLVFFLLTVMVVSLVLTRGKRMFGSMI